MDCNYLLSTPLAQQLYEETARSLPLIDYHNHLSVDDLIQNRTFQDIAELWVINDPYKHRAMRICGVDEALITGNADHKEKFHAWCETYPKLMGNPLFDWSQMELEQIFHVHTKINGSNADRIWNEINEKLHTPEFSAQGLFSQFHVEYAAPCADLLDNFSEYAQVNGLAPSLRGDNLLCPSLDFIKKLETAANTAIYDLPSFHKAILQQLDKLEAAQCHFADHALDNGFIYYRQDGSEQKRFSRILHGEMISEEDKAKIMSDMLRMLGAEYAKRHWVLQLHIGAQRFTSSRLRAVAGPAGGFAGIGNSVNLISLVNLLDDLEQSSFGLPKTILYTLNPADNAMFATLSGSFPGVTQGPAWWWCDHLQGMRDMLDTFTCHSVLSTFVGMTTDSRSLLSLLRHDYFRRMLCGWIGQKAACHELPDDQKMLSSLVKAICYDNAKNLMKEG